MFKKLGAILKAFFFPERRWQNYSYTTKTVIENGEEVVKYDRIKQVCGNTGKVRYIKG
jgi:hypothetical protein